MRRFGLTLTELILVIGIIAVLFALLAPSLQRSRLQAKAVVCMSNIRQLNSVFSVYVDDTGNFPYGFFSTDTPPPGGSIGISTYDRSGWWWLNYLGEFYKKNMGSKTVLQCPSKQIKQRGLKNSILCGNYGANLSICRMSVGITNQDEFIGKPRAFSEILRPAQTLLIVDSGYAILSWWHAADFPPATLGSAQIEDTAYVPGLSINRQRQLWSWQEIDAFYGRHPQMTVNVGFADGHVSRTKAEDLLVKKTSDGHYENRFPLWTPDSK